MLSESEPSVSFHRIHIKDTAYPTIKIYQLCQLDEETEGTVQKRDGDKTRSEVPIVPQETHKRPLVDHAADTNCSFAISTPKKKGRIVPFSDSPLNITADCNTSIETCMPSEYIPSDISMSASEYNNTTACDWTDNAPFEYVLVHKSKLKHLFNFCSTCGSNTSQTQPKKVSGSLIEIETECLQHHTTVWQSQNVIDKKPIGNVEISSAVYLSGINFAAFQRFTSTLQLQTIQRTAHYDNVANYISPVLRSTWIKHREEVIREENLAAANDQRGTRIVTDGQFDSPGRAAYICTVTAQLERNDKIIDFIDLKKDPNGIKDMETAGTDAIIDRLDKSLDNLTVVCTDRSPSVIKLMSTNYPQIDHSYDLWHIGKSFKKRYNAVAQKKGMKKLLAWKHNVILHLWHCCANCDGNSEILIEKFVSLLQHVLDRHVWEDGKHVFGCYHTDDPNISGDKPAIFDEDDLDYIALCKLIMDPALHNDLRHAIHFIHTGPLECFHNVRLIYMQKKNSYTLGGMIDRGIVAALDNNHNVGREIVGYKLLYSKKAQRWLYVDTYAEKSNAWRLELQARIADIKNTPTPEEYGEEFTILFGIFPSLDSSAPYPRPDDENLPVRRTRF